jgi:hypothetical protein
LVPRSARFRSFFFTGLAAGAAAGEVAGAAVAPACCCVAELVEGAVVALSAEAMPAAPAIMIAAAAAPSQAVWIYPIVFFTQMTPISKLFMLQMNARQHALKHTEHIRGTML